MMYHLPIRLIELIFKLPFMRRPHYIATIAPERPGPDELAPGLLIIEKREGYLKWAHLSCPKCGDHIELQLAGGTPWTVHVDFLRRPTVSPSIWETESCGAHFFVRKGAIEWCS